MVDTILDLWANLSRKVISSVLIDDGAIFPVIEVVKHNASLFAPKERPIWRGILGCVEANTPPTVEAVSMRLGGDVPAEYIQHVASLFNDDDNRHLVYNAEQLKQVAMLVKLREIGKELTGVKSVDEVDAAVDRTTTELRGLYAEKSTRTSDAEAVDAAVWQQVEQFSELVIPTGLGWFDRLAGGLWPGMNYWIVAAYKSGKTTLMRNILLTAAQADHSVAAYCAEGTRELFTLDCQVMLANKILLGKYGLEGEERLKLSKLTVMQGWRRHRNEPIFTKDEYEAIQEARRIWRTLPIRVYDTVDGIRHLATLHYDIKRDKLENGTVAVFLDYSQLFGQGKNLFEQQSTTAKAAQEIAQSEGVAITILAQKNEESVKGGGGSYSPGVKGGGDAPAAADFLMVPQIDPDNRRLFKVELTHSRHTQTGKGTHKINPTSGLILYEMEARR